MIVKTLNLRNDQVVVDLGAGDGAVVFYAATEAQHKRLNTSFLALEINPILLLLLYYRRFMHANRDRIKIVYGDFFRRDYLTSLPKAKHRTFFMYLSPWYLEKIVAVIRKEFKRFEMVSYFYPLPARKGYKLTKSTRNIPDIYRYS